MRRRHGPGEVRRAPLECRVGPGRRTKAPLVAHRHLGLGKLYRQTGKRIESDEHLTSATTMYREMGMTYWLERAEAEINNVD